MTIDRRKFIFSGFAVSLGVLAYGGYEFFTGSPDDIVVSILTRRLGYLKVSKPDFIRFAKEYVASKNKKERRQLQLGSVISLPMRFFSPYEFLPQGNPIRRLENNVVTNFLLSTDFFLNGADESRKVTYLAFYNPLIRPCQNPFMVY